MKILAVPDPRKSSIEPPEVERRFALQQRNDFIRLVEIMPNNGAECSVIEIVERGGELQLHICGGNTKFGKIINYSRQPISGPFYKYSG